MVLGENEKENTSHCIILENTEVEFPFQAYDCQLVYMSKVISALKDRKHALLESPTGTGKTLCLLCSALAYQKAVIRMKSKDPFLSEPPGGVKRLKLPLFENPMLKQENGFSFSESGFPAKNRSLFPKIIYASRTHSQLKQVINELKKTAYCDESRMGYHLRTRVIGSRDQLCVHPSSQQLSGNALNSACRSLVKNQKCRFYGGLRKNSDLEEFLQELPPMDVEDFRAIACGKKNASFKRRGSAVSFPNFCPFYASREKQMESHITFLPYNYLFDPSYRDALKLDLKGTIVIFDEAHNIEQVAENAASFDLVQKDIFRAIRLIDSVIAALQGKEVQKAVSSSSKLSIAYEGSSAPSVASSSTHSKENSPLDVSAVVSLRESLAALDDWMSSVPLVTKQKELVDFAYASFEVDEILSLFEGPPFNFKSLYWVESIESLFKKISEFVESETVTGGQEAPAASSTISSQLSAVENLSKAFKMLFSNMLKASKQQFQVFITDETATGGAKERKDDVCTATVTEGARGWALKRRLIQNDAQDAEASRTRFLSFWCFSASASMIDLVKQDVHSIIVTSGTLAPLSGLATQLTSGEFSFQVQLENSHVIKSTQLWAGIVGSFSMRGFPHEKTEALISTYENRSQPAYIQALGATILRTCESVKKGGVIVFFTSYSFLSTAVQKWKLDGTYSRMQKTKQIFVEPNSAFKFDEMLAAYRESICRARAECASLGSCNGAVLMAVFRGKVSEGIDFSDDFCRVVVITGLPFPNLKDPKIFMKQRWIQKNSSLVGGRTNGSTWYTQQAMRAVNQAVGRVIRHRLDFGAILFVDKRFTESGVNTLLACWVKKSLSAYRDMNSAFLNLRGFFTGSCEADPLHDSMPISQLPGNGLLHGKTGSIIPNHGPVSITGGGHINWKETSARASLNHEVVASADTAGKTAQTPGGAKAKGGFPSHKQAEVARKGGKRLLIGDFVPTSVHAFPEVGHSSSITKFASAGNSMIRNLTPGLCRSVESISSHPKSQKVTGNSMRSAGTKDPSSNRIMTYSSSGRTPIVQIESSTGTQRFGGFGAVPAPWNTHLVHRPNSKASSHPDQDKFNDLTSSMQRRQS